MGIDISSIKNESLREKAKMADQNGNGNGQLDAGEISVFEQTARGALISEQKDGIKAGFEGSELADIINLSEKINKSSSETNTVSNPVKASYSKKDIKRAESYALTVLKEEIGNKNLRETLVDRLGMKEPDGANINNQEYQKLLAKFDKVADEIKKVGYDSKADVEALKKKVNIDKKDDFTKDVLKVLIDDAETKQRTKEYDKMAADYKDAVEAGMNEEEAYRQVRKEYKDKGSYYKDYLKHGSLAYKVFHFKRKSSEFEKNTIMADARKTARMAQRESDATSSRKVKQDAKDTMKQNGDWNKYTKKALNGENSFGEWISGKDSDMKIGRKNVARKNTVEQIQENGLTEKQIHKAIDKRSTFGSKVTLGLFFKKKTQLFEALKASGLIEDKGNGNFDVSKLSLLIGDNVGADYKLNRQSKDFKALSEITKTTSALAVATELKNLSPKEAKMLVEMCGYDIEGKGLDVGKSILGATIGALVSGLGGASAAATNKRPIIDSSVTNKNHVEVNIKCEGKVLDEIIDQVEGQGGQANLVEGGIQIVIDQKNVVPLYWKASRQILKTALKSAMVGAAYGMLAGLKDKPETPITSTQFDCTSLEDYGKRIDNEVKQKAISPKYAEALKLIAATFVKKDANGETVWDCDQFKAYLNKAAGDGGILNREEFITMLERSDNNKKIPDDKPNDNGNGNGGTVDDGNGGTVDDGNGNGNVVAPKTCTITVDQEADQKIEIPTLTRKQTKTWNATVKTYYPCLVQKYGEKKAIRMMKLAQGIRDGNYSEERMEKLYKDTLGLKSEAAIKAYKAEGFDSAYYYDRYNDTDLPETVFAPAEIGECSRKANVTVGKVKIDRYAKKARKGGTKITNSTKAGDTTMSICGDAPHKVKPNEVQSRYDSYVRNHPDVTVTLDDRRKKK